MAISRKEFGKLKPVTSKDNERLKKEAKKEYNEEYNEKNKEVIAAKGKEYRKEHEEERATYMKEYDEGRKEEKKEYMKGYKKIHKNRHLILGSFGEEGFSIILDQNANATGKIIGVGHFTGIRTPEQNRLNTMKRKLRNVTVLNEWFEGSELHHITKDVAIYIPKELHHSIWHNLKTGEGMEEINDAAQAWLSNKEKCVCQFCGGEVNLE